MRAPEFYELTAECQAEETSAGQRSWYVRAQNFCVSYTVLDAGVSLSEDVVPDEHFLLVPPGTAVRVGTEKGEEATTDGAAVLIVPPGASHVVAECAGELLRVFSARASQVLARAVNAASYAEAVSCTATPLPAEPTEPGPGTLRMHRLADVPEDPKRFGRIFRTDSLMINWFAPQEGPRDTDALTPHKHDDFDQASVTLGGDYIHHVRRPWTPRLRDWRADQHVQCSSPSITILPAGNIHTTRAVGPGVHHLIDVFAPPRTDFAERGWILTAADYPRRDDAERRTEPA